MGYLIQLGTYAPLLDTFTAVVDCNDGQNLEVADLDGLTLPAPVLDVYTATNARLHGERVTQSTYGSRQITLTMIAGPAASYASLQSTLQKLLRLQETVRVARQATLNGQTSAARVALLLQPPGSTTPVYADVLALSHDFPAVGDAQAWVRAVQAGIGVELFCAPFLRGNRVTLQNLVNNAGFEAPAPAGTLAFSDPLANFNAYAPQWKAALQAVNPTAWWRQTESSGTTLVDSAAGAYLGTYANVTLGQPSFNADAASTSALYNGSSSAASVPFTSALNTATWTAGGWVYFTGGAGAVRPLLVSMSDGSHGWALYVDAATSKFAVDMGTGSGAVFPTTSVVASLNTWYFFCVTYDGTNVNLYINPSSSTPNTFVASAFAPATSTAMTIGAWPLQSAFLAGRAEDCFICNTALAGATILSLYQAGGTLTQDTVRYPDAVLADTPARYYRLDEASGTVVYDAMGNGANGLGTTHGSPTQGVTGALTGDSDTAYTFTAASSQYVALVTTGWPTGNPLMTLEAWVKFAANPAASATIVSYGNAALSHSAFQMYIDTSGRLIGSTIVGDTTPGAALATGVYHHCVMTWDGTTLKTYVDGAHYGTDATPTTPTIPTTTYAIIGGEAKATPDFFFNGQIDEVAIYVATLSPARIAAHYSAGTTTPAAASNTMVIPNGGRVSFGSPNWQTVNQWQIRLRYLPSLAATFYLHYLNSTNYLAVTLTGAQLALVHVVAGTTYTLGTASMTLVNGMQYWLQATLFPSFGQPPLVQALVFADAAFAPATLLVQTGPVPAHDAITAMSGQPQIAGSGAALGLSNQSVRLFGPGGWYLQTSGTGVASGAWDQVSANTYGGGPAQSFAAGRCDAPPAGTFNANWIAGDTSSAARVQQTALPVAAPGDVLGVTVFVKSTGVANTCTQQLFFSEYDVNGNGLRTGAVVAFVTGAQASYVALAGSYTTGASCAYVLLNLNALDTTTASAGGTVWFDNAQVWDQTATGMATMPYCELATGNAPAQLLVSGLQGDVPAPCQIAFGVQPAGAGLAASGSLTLYAGRRALAGFGAQLVGAALQGQQDGTNQKMVVDATSWSGARDEFHTGAANYQPLLLSGLVREYVGVYHLMLRLRMVDTPAASQNLIPQAYLLQHPWLGNANKLDRLSIFGGAPIFPFTGASWQLADAGQLVLPPFPLATQGDGAQIYTTIAAQSTTAATEMDADWGALMPVDGELLAATFQNNSIGPTLSGWIWLYFDGLSLHNAAQATAGWSLETTRLPNPAHAGGGAGVVAQATPSIISVGDTLPHVDPTITTTNGAQTNSGVNQWVVVATDNAATVLPMTCQITYAPLYLEPR